MSAPIRTDFATALGYPGVWRVQSPAAVAVAYLIVVEDGLAYVSPFSLGDELTPAGSSDHWHARHSTDVHRVDGPNGAICVDLVLRALEIVHEPENSTMLSNLYDSWRDTVLEDDELRRELARDADLDAMSRGEDASPGGAS